MKRIEVVATCAVAVMVIFASTFGGGWLRPDWTKATILVVAALSWIVLFAASTERRILLKSLTRDPLTYLAALFMVYLLIQWFNSGRAWSFDGKAWHETLPPIPWLPSSFSRHQALDPFVFFFPAFTVMLLIRLALRSTLAIRTLWTVLAAHAVILACLAFALTLFELPVPTWKLDRIAGFGYRNHAGNYMLIAVALTVGLFLRDASPSRLKRNHKRRLTLLLASVLLCAAVHHCKSMASILLCWALIASAVIYYLFAGGAAVDPAARLSLALLLVLGGASVWMLATARKSEKNLLMHELSEATFAGITNNLSTRVWQYEAAVEIVRRNPAFGSGGWGFPMQQAIFLPKEHLPKLKQIGRAHVHCDPLEFTVEFGAVGMGILLLAAGVASRRIFSEAIWHPCVFAAALGSIMTVAHSFIDLPFRSPAILYLWSAALAGAGQYAGILETKNAKRQGSRP